VFVGLVDTRPRPEPEPDPEPRRSWTEDVPWRAVAVALVTLVLVAGAMSVSGLAGLVLVLLAVIVPATAIERSLASWSGLKEHRQ